MLLHVLVVDIKERGVDMMRAVDVLLTVLLDACAGFGSFNLCIPELLEDGVCVEEGW